MIDAYEMGKQAAKLGRISEHFSKLLKEVPKKVNPLEGVIKQLHAGKTTPDTATKALQAMLRRPSANPRKALQKRIAEDPWWTHFIS